MKCLLVLALHALAALLTPVLGAEVVPRATFTEVRDYGSNPTGTGMWLYVPRNLAAKPAVVVGLHWCSGSAQAYYQGTHWASNAEKYGYIVIYPQTPYLRSNCWDVSSKKTLTHGGGGVSTSMANMVSFVIAQYGADEGRVFATGTSSGAMMTNVLAATYPDVFAAGIAYAGVPAGCFMSADESPDYWNGTCSLGQTILTQQQWADVAKAMYPGYTGPRPKMQIYHGSLDTTLYVQNYYETIKQWTGLFGYSTTPASETPNYPRSPYTKYVFGDKLETFLGNGVTHSIDVFAEEDLKWFGFLTPVSPSSAATTSRASTTLAAAASTTTAAGATTTSAAAGSGTAPQWGQCGGIGWTGPATCVDPFKCNKVNDWYSQCQ
ncbi:PHB depolymerase family esterase [Colletotrichum navitas]|uniref:Carboxylic ester hydrolase n=1 Tax=Colletotrichum navitas TaxID=681940 RepID=A0AAD8V5I6_9PEZI|nr:PHB depolymerase family esterase [Colletotrichum navitas]KAK1593418.1 PHB depolymerase family esterase [Colletotrichum navitas]